MIHAAAIKYRGMVYTLPAPARHHDIIAYIIDECDEAPPIRGEQGFIDTEQGFVSRYVAYDIAVECNQLIRPCPPMMPQQLYSENVW